jgi:hypothetical protein
MRGELALLAVMVSSFGTGDCVFEYGFDWAWLCGLCSLYPFDCGSENIV